MHIVNRVLFGLLGLALVTLGGVVVAEAVAAARSLPPLLIDPARVADTLSSSRWTDPEVRTVAAALVVLGLVLIVVEVKPRRPDDYQTSSSTGARRLTYDRHGLTRLASQVAEGHPDVAEVSRVALHRRRLRMTTSGYVDIDRAAVRRAVEQRVGDALAELGLRRPPRVKVTVLRSDRRTR